MATYNQTFTLTFGDCGENHKGMQKIGVEATDGFDLADLLIAADWFEERGIETELHCLHDLLPHEVSIRSEVAYLLIARNGLSVICNPGELYNEQDQLSKDRKAI